MIENRDFRAAYAASRDFMGAGSADETWPLSGPQNEGRA